MGRKGDVKNSSSNGNGRVKFRYSDGERYMDFEMEGGNDELADGFKSLAIALSRPALSPVKALAGPKGSRSEMAVEVPENEGHIVSEDSVNAESDGSVIEAEENTSSKAKKKYTPKAPKFLNELDLTKAPVTLNQFIETKKPKEMLDKYTVVAEWFREYMNIQEIGMDHIYTAFGQLGWKSQLPDDVLQPLRDLKSKKNLLDKGTKGMYKINWNGTNTVNKMEAEN